MQKYLLAGFMVLFSTPIFCAETATLTQDEYDQRMQKYTDQVNATKLILDAAEPPTDATQQRLAFCSRLEAYQEIYHLSQANMQLDNAKMMSLIATRFLEQQKKSLEESGMTSTVFCGTAANSK